MRAVALMPSRLEVQGREVRLVVEDRDAEYPLVVDPAVVYWTQQQKLLASNPAGGDLLGWSVSVSGDTAVIGAPDKNGNQGAAYVFVRSGTSWTQLQELTALDGTAGDLFGYSVSVSGDTAVIGAAVKTVGMNGGQGAAYVFVRSGGVPPWTQQQKLTASDGTTGDEFGYSVSVSGNTAVVGAAYKGVGNRAGQGIAYVFVRNGGVPSGSWTQQQELAASDGFTADKFGCSVSVSGNTAMVGAYGHTVGSNPSQGVAYVFARSSAASMWTQQQELTGSDSTFSDEFGWSVSVSGNTAVVGAPIHTIPGNQGRAYVFVSSGGAFTQQQELAASDAASGDYFGYSVSVSGDTAVIGSERVSGVAYVFARNGSAWTQQQELTGMDVNADDGFGYSVAVSGGTAVVGAYNHTTTTVSGANQGAAYVFVSQGVFAQSVSPNAGSGLSQTFTAVYSDSNGASDLAVVYLDIGSGVGFPHTCFAAYIQGSNQLYLFNDTNNAILGPITPGSSSTQSNSQCTLSGSGGAASASGNELTVPFAITFKAGYTGPRGIYGLAQNNTGMQSADTFLGTWTPSEPALAAVSVNPINGSGAGPQTFNALYTDTTGAADVQVVYLIFGSSTPLVPNGCFVAYVPFGNQLYLFNDADTGVTMTSPITAGTASTTSNSQCTLSGSGGTATLSVNNFTAPFNLSFSGTFTSTVNVYGLVQSYDGTQSAWTLLGTWTP